MKIRLPPPWASAGLLIGVGTLVGVFAMRKSPVAKTTLPCDGEYAESLQLPRGRDLDHGKSKQFTYLIRSSAKFECPYFASNGKLLRRHVRSVEHGTAFAYEIAGDETFLLTNEHVAMWPEVTDANHKIDGVSEGCRRIEHDLRIVQDERDEFEPGHVPLKLVAADPALDAAILKASARLTVMPYRMGKSAALRQGNAVQVRGFPLGLLHAVNTGKVVNPHDLDQEQGWNHVDFVTDALLSEGNSGSPVMALSCQTAELQLVGMYHAGYKGHSALNVVVGIDYLREFMIKKRRIPRATSEASQALGTGGRKRLRETLASGTLPLFEFGGLHVWAGLDGDVLLYHVYDRDFPTDDRRIAILEDRPSPTTFGEITRLWVRGETRFRERALADLHEDEQELVRRLADAIRMHILRVAGYRRALAGEGTAEERRRGREVLRTIERHASGARDLTQGLIDLAEQLATAAAGVAQRGSGADAAAPPPTPTAQVGRP